MSTRLTKDIIITDLNRVKRKSHVVKYIIGSIFCLAGLGIAAAFYYNGYLFYMFLIPVIVFCIGILVMTSENIKNFQVDQSWECVLATLKEKRVEEHGYGENSYSEVYLDFEFDGEIYVYRFQSLRKEKNVAVGNRYYIVKLSGQSDIAIKRFGDVLRYYPEEDYFLGLNDEIVNSATAYKKNILSSVFSYFFSALLFLFGIWIIYVVPSVTGIIVGVVWIANLAFWSIYGLRQSKKSKTD